jgi:hypothetical protein
MFWRSRFWGSGYWKAHYWGATATPESCPPFILLVRGDGVTQLLVREREEETFLTVTIDGETELEVRSTGLTTLTVRDGITPPAELRVRDDGLSTLTSRSTGRSILIARPCP